MIVQDCDQKERVRKARDRFFGSLHAGNIDAAYAQLSAERRAVMSKEAFAAFIDHPVYMDAGATYDMPEQDAPGYCMNGYVDRPEGEWYIQLFLIEEGDALKMHAMGLQRPTKMHLGTLLPPCGFWKGTLAGYGGPPPERTMETTRDQW